LRSRADRRSAGSRSLRQRVAKVKVDDPSADDTIMGPVVSETQFDKIQAGASRKAPPW
jgi:acyl-CoA reductase-like NAD-dependent aldehyde dehydrogenase